MTGTQIMSTSEWTTAVTSKWLLWLEKLLHVRISFWNLQINIWATAILFSMPPNIENCETNTFHKLHSTSVCMYEGSPRSTWPNQGKKKHFGKKCLYFST
jgi:hypothetical protein